MSIYKQVLVSIDGSDTSKYALREFIRSIKSENLNITVVSVLPMYEGDVYSLWTKDIRTSTEKVCENYLAEARQIAHEEGVTVETVSAEGEIHEKIVELADAGNYDLIVLGKKGMSLIEKAFVGSVTSRVIGYSRQDVLVIPYNAKLAWKKLLLTTDGSVYSNAAAQTAISIAKQHHGEIKVLSVVDMTIEFMLRAHEVYDKLVAKAKNFTNEIKEKAFSAEVPVEPLVRDGEVYQVIIDAAKEYETDMIVMGNLGRTGLKRLLMGSTAERVLGHAAFPVLIVKP